MKRCSNSLTIKKTGIKTRQNQYIHNGWAIIRRLDNAKENLNSCFLEHRQIQPLWRAAQQESVKLSMRKTQQSYSWYFPNKVSIDPQRTNQRMFIEVASCRQPWEMAKSNVQDAHAEYCWVVAGSTSVLLYCTDRILREKVRND